MKKLTIKDFTPKKIKDLTILIVTWDELKTKMSKKEFNKFEEWMFCQACALEGVYIHDLKKYLSITK